jgi:hypothetical protein
VSSRSSSTHSFISIILQAAARGRCRCRRDLLLPPAQEEGGQEAVPQVPAARGQDGGTRVEEDDERQNAPEFGHQDAPDDVQADAQADGDSRSGRQRGGQGEGARAAHRRFDGPPGRVQDGRSLVAEVARRTAAQLGPEDAQTAAGSAEEAAERSGGRGRDDRPVEGRRPGDESDRRGLQDGRGGRLAAGGGERVASGESPLASFRTALTPNCRRRSPQCATLRGAKT